MSLAPPVPHFLRLFLFLPIFFLAPASAWAWNAAGHRLVACIAWEFLDSTARVESLQLLRAHPDFARWADRVGDEATDRLIFIEASTWPDEIRRDARFYTAGKSTPTALLPGFSDMDRHANWHYVNRPIDGTRAPENSRGLIDRQLVALAKTIGSARAYQADKAYALPWLIHLTGDVHQPLHTSMRPRDQGKWDKLGIGLTVTNPFNPRKQTSTLHVFWDDLPGPSSLRGKRLDSACRALVASQTRPPASSSSAQWVDESWLIARSEAYPPTTEFPPTITAQFFENSREIANRRITHAGYRLADLLNAKLSRTGGH